MEKDEILKKAQGKKPNTPDEMELAIVQKGNGIAVFSILVVSLILMIAKIIVDQPWLDVYCIVFTGMAAQHIYKGIKLHQKHHIVLAIVTGIVSIAMLIGYLFQILG